MSDLISRSELLKAMDTWDNFGYDEHNRLIKIDRTNEEYVPYVHYEDMVKCVNGMPTAYSVDKVVEEMEELKAIKSDGFTDDLLNMGFTKGYNKAIDDFVRFASDMPTVKEEDGTIRPMRLEEMAEQLKAGVKYEM